MLLGIGIAPALVAAVTLIISLGYEDGIAAVAHAQRGKTTRNRFAVDALCAYISRIEQDDRPLLESIRQMLREEIGSTTITSTIPAVQVVSTELTEEQKEDNRRNVLQDLDDLFG